VKVAGQIPGYLFELLRALLSGWTRVFPFGAAMARARHSRSEWRTYTDMNVFDLKLQPPTAEQRG